MGKPKELEKVLRMRVTRKKDQQEGCTCFFNMWGFMT